MRYRAPYDANRLAKLREMPSCCGKLVKEYFLLSETTNPLFVKDASFFGNNTPGSNALQLTLQPFFVTWPSDLKNMLTTLLVLVMLAGRAVPQLFSIMVVPSPSVIVRWSYLQVAWVSMSNAVNCNNTISPWSTRIVSVLAIFLG